MSRLTKWLRRRAQARAARPRETWLPAPLSGGRKGSSQINETGLIETILKHVPVRRKIFVEFGIGPGPGDPEHRNGLEGNCVDLKAAGWNGLFMDGGTHPPQFEVRSEFVTEHNINDLLRKYAVPDDFALISIDVDGQEYWIWKALRHSPEIVIIEYNAERGPDEAVTIIRDPDFRWDGTNYHGASLRALWQLGTERGYTLVHGNRVNAFFVRSDLIANKPDFEFSKLYERVKIHVDDPLERPWFTV